MNRTDTADRLRPADLVLIDKDLADQHPDLAGKWWAVDDITDAGSAAHPGRLTVKLQDPHGRLFFDDDPRTAFIYAGDICTFRVHNPQMLGSVGIRPGGTR